MMQMKNNIMAFFFAGRTAAHGSAVETEIVGTKGMLRIGATPTNSMVEVFSESGVCRECYQDFVSRWHYAYIRELEVYCEAVLAGKQPTPNVYDGTKSTDIAFRCKESFIANELLEM